MLNLKFSLSEVLISKILNPEIKKIFILGGADSGKTSLIECILEILIGNYSISIVDCDMGQSHIGPPTTIGWARVLSEFISWEELRLEDFYFVGSLSPSGNIPRTLEGINFIFNRAKENTDKVIFDTTGYISGFEAIDFKIKELELIQPDLIVALKRGNELEDILKNIKEEIIFRMDIPKEVRLKSQSERERYRDICFRRYFSQSKEFLFDEDLIKRLDKEDSEIIDRIVSLQNGEGKDLALGRVLEKKDKKILISTPLNETKDVEKIILGLCKWKKI